MVFLNEKKECKTGLNHMKLLYLVLFALDLGKWMQVYFGCEDELVSLHSQNILFRKKDFFCKYYIEQTASMWG